MQGRRIVLGVAGGIAAYKSAELVRRLREHGAEVQVVLTAGGRQFITPLTLQALSGRPVREDLWDVQAEAAMGHIELARWAELILIAPATADLMARLAAGRADGLLTALCLASRAPLAIAPAMNHVMWSHPATRSNLALLRERGVRVLGPDNGAQACGETGPGRMLEPKDIAAECLRLLAPAPAVAPPALAEAPRSPPTPVLQGQRVLVTAGPTRERIDPVRFVSNRSSGKMGFAVAAAAREAGAEVVLVCGPVSLPTPPGVRRIDVESAADMLAAVLGEIDRTDVFIATAAVADYRPARPVDRKIKKTQDTLDIALERTPDVLATVAARPQRPFVVGFAAETDNVEANARTKLVAKRLDLIAANEVGHDKVFDCEDNELLVLAPAARFELGRASKCVLAGRLVELIARELQARRRTRPEAVPPRPAAVEAGGDAGGTRRGGAPDAQERRA